MLAANVGLYLLVCMGIDRVWAGPGGATAGTGSDGSSSKSDAAVRKVLQSLDRPSATPSPRPATTRRGAAAGLGLLDRISLALASPPSMSPSNSAKDATPAPKPGTGVLAPAALASLALGGDSFDDDDDDEDDDDDDEEVVNFHASNKPPAAAAAAVTTPSPAAGLPTAQSDTETLPSRSR